MFEGWVVVCDEYVSADFGRIEDAAAEAEQCDRTCRLEHRVELASAHPTRGSQWDFPDDYWDGSA